MINRENGVSGEIMLNTALSDDCQAGHAFQRIYCNTWLTLSTHGLDLQSVNSNCSCNMHPSVTMVLNWLRICNLPLVPSWILAVIIGLYFGNKFYNLGPSVIGSLSYAITFTMYAFMITSGLLVHCVFLVECGAAPSTNMFVDIAKMDGALTTCIAISFLFNALVDVKLLHEGTFSTLIIMLCTYVWVFYAYFLDVVSPMFLYFTSIFICCSTYLLVQIMVLFNNHCKALVYLFASGVFGGVSFWLFKYESCWLCKTFGAWSVEGVWYYGSDAAMLMIGLYVWNTRRTGLKFKKEAV